MLLDQAAAAPPGRTPHTTILRLAASIPQPFVSPLLRLNFRNLANNGSMIAPRGISSVDASRVAHGARTPPGPRSPRQPRDRPCCGADDGLPSRWTRPPWPRRSPHRPLRTSQPQTRPPWRRWWQRRHPFPPPTPSRGCGGGGGQPMPALEPQPTPYRRRRHSLRIRNPLPTPIRTPPHPMSLPRRRRRSPSPPRSRSISPSRRSISPRSLRRRRRSSFRSAVPAIGVELGLGLGLQ